MGVWGYTYTYPCRCVLRGGFLLGTASSARDGDRGGNLRGNRRALDGRAWMNGWMDEYMNG